MLLENFRKTFHADVASFFPYEKNIDNAVAHLQFPRRGGCQPKRGTLTYYLGHFSHKMHEMREGGRVSPHPPQSANAMDSSDHFERHNSEKISNESKETTYNSAVEKNHEAVGVFVL